MPDPYDPTVLHPAECQRCGHVWRDGDLLLDDHCRHCQTDEEKLIARILEEAPSGYAHGVCDHMNMHIKNFTMVFEDDHRQDIEVIEKHYISGLIAIGYTCFILTQGELTLYPPKDPTA